MNHEAPLFEDLTGQGWTEIGELLLVHFQDLVADIDVDLPVRSSPPQAMDDSGVALRLQASLNRYT